MGRTHNSSHRRMTLERATLASTCSFTPTLVRWMYSVRAACTHARRSAGKGCDDEQAHTHTSIHTVTPPTPPPHTTHLQRGELARHGAGVGQKEVERGQPALLQPLPHLRRQILPPPPHRVRPQELGQGRGHARGPVAGPADEPPAEDLAGGDALAALEERRALRLRQLGPQPRLREEAEPAARCRGLAPEGVLKGREERIDGWMQCRA